MKNGKTAPEMTDEKIGPMVVRRRKDEGSREEGEDAVHPSLKKFHSTVMKLVDVTDELVFRRIVSFL